MAVTRQRVQRMVIPALRIEKFISLDLALREEAEVFLSGKKGEARIGLGRLSHKIFGQLLLSFHADEMAAFNASLHLFKERERNLCELLFQPLVGFVAQVFVPPERRAPAAV